MVMASILDDVVGVVEGGDQLGDEAGQQQVRRHVAKATSG
jgi:hypothetical protein